MTYDPIAYWIKRGRHWEDEARKRGFWDAENPPLLQLMDTLHFDSVLDVGCGFGRVGASILERWPDVRYTGIDVSPDLIEGARKRLPDSELIVADLAQFDTDRMWDLVLSVSVLGHIRPDDVGPLIERMRRWARRDVIHVDWDEPGAFTSFRYGHDFRALHGPAIEIPMGRQTLFHLKP